MNQGIVIQQFEWIEREKQLAKERYEHAKLVYDMKINELDDKYWEVKSKCRHKNEDGTDSYIPDTHDGWCKHCGCIS